ncbi:hypothetical protein, partial [Helicobacter marmotae]|uniref:hypothetical protein n=1 Tax=Helicobacter marmotae TaxID=152490 RepID=UPI001B860CC9
MAEFLAILTAILRSLPLPLDMTISPKRLPAVRYILTAIKLNRTKCHLLRRRRGGGYIRGRERLRNSSPS